RPPDRHVRALPRSPLFVTGACLVVCVVSVALLAPALSPFDPRTLSGDALEPPSARHLLGTNDIGQDIASQVIWGARTSLALAVGAAALSVVIGFVVGVSAGAVGGTYDTVLMRVVDVALATPRLPLLVLVAALAGAGRTTLIVLIGLITCAVPTRVLRSEVLILRRRGFVEAARGFGAGLPHVAHRHFLPALGPLLVSHLVLIAGTAVLLEAELAFLGLSDPTAMSWGLMLNRGVRETGLYFTSAWAWLLLPAGFALTIAVLGFAFLGVGLEPFLNPRAAKGR
nr:ABC transporter permease [Actinomycetota bacterium]